MSLFKVISKTNKGTNRYHNPITACLGGGIDARNVHHNLICMTLKKKKIRLTKDKKKQIKKAHIDFWRKVNTPLKLSQFSSFICLNFFLLPTLLKVLRSGFQSRSMLP